MGRTLKAEKKRVKVKKKKGGARGGGGGGRHPSGLFSTEDASDTDLADRNEHEAPNFFTAGLKRCGPDWAHTQVVQPSEKKNKAKTSALPTTERERPPLCLTTCLCDLSGFSRYL